MYGSEVSIKIAEYMERKDPEVLKLAYTGLVFEGENLLHIAIVKKNKKLVKRLLSQAPELLEGRATGNFFHVRLQAYPYSPLVQ